MRDLQQSVQQILMMPPVNGSGRGRCLHSKPRHTRTKTHRRKKRNSFKMQYLRQTIDPLAVKIFTPHTPPSLFIFRHRSGAEKNPSVPGATRPPHKKQTDGRTLANRLSSADLRPQVGVKMKNLKNLRGAGDTSIMARPVRRGGIFKTRQEGERKRKHRK